MVIESVSAFVDVNRRDGRTDSNAFLRISMERLQEVILESLSHDEVSSIMVCATANKAGE